MKVFFLEASFISTLMIVVNLLFFSSIHCCFVHLCFQGIWLWRISTLKEKRKYEWVVLSWFFVLFVLNVIVFVYNGLKQSLILQTKPNHLLEISSFHMILMFISKKHLVPYIIETRVQVCCYVHHLHVGISYFALQICINLTREKFLVSLEKKGGNVCIYTFLKKQSMKVQYFLLTW